MPPEANSPLPALRVGLLVNSTELNKYDAQFVHWAKTQDNVLVSHLILHSPRSPKDKVATARKPFPLRVLSVLKNRGLRATLEGLVWNYIEKSEQRMLLKNDVNLRDHHATEDVSELVPEQLRIIPKVSPSGFVFRFSAEDVEAVKALDLDVLIRCGDGILRGDLLNASRFGVLSFHHADSRINRGGPPAFWEAYHKLDQTGFTIQRLTDVLDGGEAFVRGHFPTQYPYLVNEAQLFAKANPFMQQLVSQIAQDRAMPEPLAPTPYSGRLFVRPNLLQMLNYLGQRFIHRTRRQIIYRAGYQDLWHVGYCHSDWSDAELWRGPKIPNPPGTFLADPFVVHRDGSAYCFLEELDLAKDLAVISVYELGKKSATRLGVVLDEPFHLSFPFIFEYEDELFMCPETASNNDIRVYQCDEFPLRWSLRQVLKPDFSAADTMLFEHDGRWWMFTNTDAADIDEFCSELHIFYSDSPLSTDWTPHQQNPIYIDSSRARNGGLLHKDGDLYRVAQEQGFATYGAACRINKIVELTPENYREEELVRVSPQFSDGAHGGHHLHSDGKVTVFDYRAFEKV